MIEHSLARKHALWSSTALPRAWVLERGFILPSQQAPNCISAGWSWRGASSATGAQSNRANRD